MEAKTTKIFFVIWFTLISTLANFDFLHFHSFHSVLTNHKFIQTLDSNTRFSNDRCLLDYFLLLLSNVISVRFNFKPFLIANSIVFPLINSSYALNFTYTYASRAPPS